MLSEVGGDVLKHLGLNFLLDVNGDGGYNAITKPGKNWQHYDVQFISVVCTPEFAEYKQAHLSSKELVSQTSFRKLMQFSFYMSLKEKKFLSYPPE